MCIDSNQLYSIKLYFLTSLWLLFNVYSKLLFWPGILSGHNNADTLHCTHQGNKRLTIRINRPIYGIMCLLNLSVHIMGMFHE